MLCGPYQPGLSKQPMITNHVIWSGSMSTHFGDASPSGQHRYHGLPDGHPQSNSWWRWLDNLLRWTERSRRRAAFRNLADDRHLLDDIGFTRQQAIDEANKPFWR